MNTKGNYNWAIGYLATGLSVFCITAFLWMQYESEVRANAEKSQRSSVKAEVDRIAEHIENAIQRNSNALQALATFVAIEPELDQSKFEAYSRRSFLQNREFKLVALAPDLVVSNVFPINGNEAVIGLDYTQTPAQIAAVKKAVASSDVIIAGPVDLVQGGQALIARQSVYTASSSSFETQLWGIVSLVLDIETILKSAGVYESSMELALRGKDGLGSIGGIIHGQPNVFARNPVGVTVSLPQGSWYIAGLPKAGWIVPASTFFGLRIGFGLSALLAVIVIWSVMRLVQLRLRADTRLSAAIDSIDDGFAYYDSDDRLVICNAKYKEIYGVSAEAIVPGAKFEDIIRFGVAHGQYPEAIGREEQFLRDRMAAHRSGGIDLEQELEDGRWLKVSESRTPDGGLVGFRVDITELKKAKEEAERANLAKSEFLDVMSHELRTPLTVVLGGTPFLRQPELLPAATKLFNSLEAKGADAEEIKAEVEALLSSLKSLAGKVERSAKHLLTLINDVLDFSKIEAGRMGIRAKPVNLGGVIDGLLKEFGPKAEAKSLYMNADIGEHYVEADEYRLRQVLVNIIDNALKFTKDGGVTIDVDDRGPQVKVIIADTGSGIPESRLGDVFDKFSQVDGSSSRKTGGTGLGMAITKKIVEMHGGQISVESKVGEGSTFTFTLPRAKAADSDEATEPAVAISA